jgi:anaerobic selenocysteine-containing dehydrogenase
MGTHYRTCPLCEATCGLEIVTRGEEVVSIRGDEQDVLSHGFLCPKGVALKELHEAPDRVRTPLIHGTPASWDDAFALIEERLSPLLAADRNSVAVYLGNPSAHNLSNQLYAGVFLKALASRNVYSASTLDQFPKQAACGLMFGGGLSVPVPDVDRTDHLLILGANPLASNGSLWTAPDLRGRLRALRARGGRLVVVDPRRSRTAQEADEHVFVRPGTDAYLLFGMVHVLFSEGLADLGRLAEWTDGVSEVRALAADFAPDVVAPVCGVPAETIVRLARELAAAPRAAVYARIGTCTQEFGTLASWLVDVLNVLTGNLDREGGAMFPLAAAGQRNSSGTPRVGKGMKLGRWQSRVRGLDEVFGELPAACLAEEIETPGDGQVRALITISGNPAVSAPNAGRLDAALASLEFMVCLDVYVNETTRHADVILPAPSPLHRPHYDLALYQLAVRNVANYSPPVLEPEPDLPDEWVTLLRLTGLVAGQGPDPDVGALDDMVAAGLAAREGVDLASLPARTGPERLLDILLRGGPYDLTLADLEASPHGIDLGPLQPRLPDVLRTPSGQIELAPEPIVADVARLRAGVSKGPDPFVLIGRRTLRSNNSWMNNLPMLVRGPVRCTVHVHPDDAERLGLEDGALARVSSASGEITVPVEVTDAIMPGVVSIPHGWSHANSNLLADDSRLEAVTGNAVLNGIPVELAPVREAVPA